MTAGRQDLDALAHERASALLRRWLSETHAPVAPGALQLQLGPVRVRTEVEHCSPTGEHGFGPIRVLDESGAPCSRADPVLLATACSAEARSRATEDAPINGCGAGSAGEWALRALATGRTGFSGTAREDAVLARSVNSAGEAQRWLDTHVDRELVPALHGLDPDRDLSERATASLLTRRCLPLIGMLGRRGAADEDELLSTLATRLRQLAQVHRGRAWLLETWLDSPTLSDFAVLNGAGLRYTGPARRPEPVLHEVPNPLHRPELPPGVPVPELADWSLRPVALDDSADLDLVHRWMNSEHVASTWHQAWSRKRWHEEVSAQLGGQRSVPCLVFDGPDPVAYLELYRVARDVLGRCYPHHPRDLGVHIAIGDPQRTGRGVGSRMLRQVALGLLAADPECRRVVAEPNVHNGRSVAAFGKAGYVREGEVGLPEKNSALVVFER